MIFYSMTNFVSISNIQLFFQVVAISFTKIILLKREINFTTLVRDQIEINIEKLHFRKIRELVKEISISRLGELNSLSFSRWNSSFSHTCSFLALKFESYYIKQSLQ